MLGTFKPQPAKSVRQQIADHVRNLVRDGELAPGDKLPATLELARQWDTRPTTVQSALAMLVREGLLDRSPRIGTFVREAKTNKLRRVAIYLPENVWAEPESTFVQVLCGALAKELKQRQIEAVVRIHPETPSRGHEPWTELVDAARRREIQGIIAPRVDTLQWEWLSSLPVPTAFVSSGTCRNRVDFDQEEFCADALAELKAQGCRSAGLITSIARINDDGSDAQFHQYFKAAAEKLGLERREAWIKAPERWYPFSGEALGHAGFQELWQASPRTEGLVVFPDTVARGVLLGVMGLQVSVPADLKLVLHRNREIGLVCPVPATFMDVSVATVARELVALIERQFNGEAVEPAILRYEAVHGTVDKEGRSTAKSGRGGKVAGRSTETKGVRQAERKSA